MEPNESQVTIGGVHIIFQISLQVATVSSIKPTEFTKNYLKTLITMAGDHFIKQMQESLVERVKEDFSGYSKEALWQK